ncbi:hypothetical protein NEMIN01_2095 [Nematocida minor]|uniref:uncharacterized protein n=1 Tax=Nematocida minor TaxID=1912983 RepID=UPI00221FC724|nr:uncharacterized protein NEMIN01_2095 [Nematocida minor]KAI5192582.1 hypothetical protein NEMIN01_2095 [Nematocida minor]
MQQEDGKGRSSMEEISDDNKIDEKQRKDSGSTENGLSGCEQTVSNSLCKIAQLYADTFKLVEGNSNGLFTKDNAFVKLVTRHLKEEVIRFGTDHFALSYVIEFLISPAESRTPYSYGLYSKASIGVCISPELTSCSDDILNIILMFVDLQENVEDRIVVQNFALSENFRFSKFKYFSSASEVKLCNVSLHSSTFKDMENFEELLVLGFKETRLLGDKNLKTTIWVDTLLIEAVEEEEIEHFLHSIHNVHFNLSISMVNITNTQSISSLRYLSSVKILEFHRTVFKEIPDFTFIKKIKNLYALYMQNVFYGYDEKYEESLLPRIKRNVQYLNISQVQKKYHTFSEKEKKIIDENRKIGEEIAITNCYINNNIYQDLGFSNIKVNNPILIDVKFPLAIDETFFNIVSYYMKFRMSLETSSLFISSFTEAAKPDSRFLPYLSNFVFPFGAYKAIKTIAFKISHKDKITEKFMLFLRDSVCLHLNSDSVEKVTIEITSVVDLDLNTLIEYGKHFKKLSYIGFQIGKLTSADIKNINEIGVDSTSQYKVYTHNDSNRLIIEFTENT